MASDRNGQNRTLLAALYGRQSHGKKRSIAQQLEAEREVCATAGWEIFFEYRDEVSASRFSTKKRDVEGGWPKLLADLAARSFDILVLWESSRGDRDLPSWVTMLAQCRELGVRIYVCTHDRLYDMRNAREWKILVEEGTDSAYESEKTSLRILRDTDARAAAGRPHGFAPYGYRRIAVLNVAGELVGKRDELVLEQAELIRGAAEALLAGESLRSISARLNKAGKKSPRGLPWESITLRQVLLRERNAGQRRHRGNVVGPGDWPPIYSEDPDDAADIHAQVVEELTKPERTTNKGAVRKHLGTGIFRCGLCGWDLDSDPPGPIPDGGTMRVNPKWYDPKRNKWRDAGYQCTKCLRLRRLQAPVDELVTHAVVERLKRNDAIVALASGDPGKVRTLHDKIAADEARLAEAADLFSEGAITAAQLKRTSTRLQQQADDARAQLARHMPAPGLLKLAGPNAAVAWANAPLSLQRAVVQALCDVVILPTGSGGKFDPESVQIIWREA